MRLIRHTVEYVHHLLAQPRDQMNRAQRWLRYAIDLTRYAGRTLARDRATQMAAALTYRTIFSLVPTVILALLLVKSLVNVNELKQTMTQKTFEILKLDQVAQGGAEQAASETRGVIENIISTTVEMADKLSFQNVGGVGLLLLLWAALAIAVTVEQCFNQIYRAPSGRRWHHKIMLYWSILTLGPMMIALSVYMATGFAAKAHDMAGIGGVVAFLGRFAGFLVTWLLFLLLYKFMPNAAVRLRPALIGALAAAVLWKLAQWGFGFYVRHTVGGATSYTQLYGSIGLLPLSLLWLYLTWIITLFGLEIAYTLQTVRRYQLQQDEAALEKRVVGDPLWLIPMMTMIGEAFVRSKTVDRQTLSDDLQLPVRIIDVMTGKLIEQGLLHRVQRSDDRDAGLSLARGPDQIRVSQLLEIGRSFSAPNTTRHGARQAAGMLANLHEAQHAAAADATLATLLDRADADER